jgi:hypothetical protein
MYLYLVVSRTNFGQWQLSKLMSMQVESRLEEHIEGGMLRTSGMVYNGGESNRLHRTAYPRYWYRSQPISWTFSQIANSPVTMSREESP